MTITVPRWLAALAAAALLALLVSAMQQPLSEVRYARPTAPTPDVTDGIHPSQLRSWQVLLNTTNNYRATLESPVAAPHGLVITRMIVNKASPVALYVDGQIAAVVQDARDGNLLTTSNFDLSPGVAVPSGSVLEVGNTDTSQDRVTVIGYVW